MAPRSEPWKDQHARLRERSSHRCRRVKPQLRSRQTAPAMKCPASLPRAQQSPDAPGRSLRPGREDSPPGTECSAGIPNRYPVTTGRDNRVRTPPHASRLVDRSNGPAHSTRVPLGVLPVQHDQFVLSFAFLPTSGILSDHEVISGVKNSQVSAIRTLVRQFERGRLIEIFEHGIVVLQLVNGSEFDTVAFELDSDSHLLARIETAYVTTATTDSPCRIRGSNVINHRPALSVSPSFLYQANKSTSVSMPLTSF